MSILKTIASAAGFNRVPNDVEIEASKLVKLLTLGDQKAPEVIFENDELKITWNDQQDSSDKKHPYVVPGMYGKVLARQTGLVKDNFVNGVYEGNGNLSFAHDFARNKHVLVLDTKNFSSDQVIQGIKNAVGAVEPLRSRLGHFAQKTFLEVASGVLDEKKAAELASKPKAGKPQISR